MIAAALLFAGGLVGFLVGFVLAAVAREAQVQELRERAQHFESWARDHPLYDAPRAQPYAAPYPEGGVTHP